MDDQFTIQIDNSNSTTDTGGESNSNAITSSKTTTKLTSFQLDDVNSTQEEIQDNWNEPREMVKLIYKCLRRGAALI